jgi:hypothetical protein
LDEDTDKKKRRGAKTLAGAPRREEPEVRNLTMMHPEEEDPGLFLASAQEMAPPRGNEWMEDPVAESRETRQHQLAAQEHAEELAREKRARDVKRFADWVRGLCEGTAFVNEAGMLDFVLRQAAQQGWPLTAARHSLLQQATQCVWAERVFSAEAFAERVMGEIRRSA